MKNLPPTVLVSALLNISIVNVASADDWACEVLLCLSNPKGAMAVAPCVPPIKKLFRELAKGHAFPKCFMGSGNGRSGAEHRYASAQYCPSHALIPPQSEGDNWSCAYAGAIVTTVDGRQQSRLWWNAEDSFTESLDGSGAAMRSRANANTVQQ